MVQHNAVGSPANLKIALVTSFPPGRGDLNEYGFHLARALKENSTLHLVVLADDADGNKELPGYNVDRCWRFNSILSPFRILRSIWKHKPDIVWFNMGFSTFARSPILAFASVAVPLLTRMLGFRVHITLHTVFERINLQDAQVSSALLYRTAGRFATRLLLWSGDVSVLMPSFRSELLNNYQVDADRVHCFPHGTFADPSVALGLPAPHLDPVILALGYWGTYKKLDLVLEAMNEIRGEVPNVTLEVAGTNHPSALGYLESLQKRFPEQHAVRFLGYVPEEQLPELFSRARLIVLPYSSAAGTSGVVHQACQYGVPLVATDIPEFVEMAKEEGVAIAFYAQGDSRALAGHVIRLLKSDETRQQFSQQNLAVGQNTPMSQVVGDYVSLFRKQMTSNSAEEISSWN